MKFGDPIPSDDHRYLIAQWKREILPDARYGSTVVSGFINRMMHNGKKSVATSVMYHSLDLVAERSKPYLDSG